MTKSLRTFYIMTITQFLSMIGSSMSGFAIGIWVFTETGNATPLLLISVFQFLPNMLAGTLSGVFADRFDRKRIIILMDLGQAIPTLAVFFLFSSDAIAIWMIYAAVFIQAIFAMQQSPAVAASITMLVPESHLDQANSIRQLIGPLAGILSPLFAGMLYAAVGVEGILIFDLITFLIAVAVISQIHIPMPKQSAESAATQGSVWSEMKGAWQFLQDRPMLLLLIMYFMVVNFLAFGPTRLTTPYILSLTDNNEATLGVLLAVMNLGMISGSIFVGVWGGTRPRIHTIMGGLLIASVGLCMYGVVRQPILLGLFMFLFLFPLPAVNAMVMSIMQLKTPPDMQGRVFALLGQLSTFSLPISALLVGPVIDQVLEPAVGKSGWDVVEPLVGAEQGSGMGLLLLLSGVALFVLTAVLYSYPRLRRMEDTLQDYVPEEAVETEPIAEDVPIKPDNTAPAGI